MEQGLFKGGVYFVQLEPDDQCWKNSREGRIQGNMELFNFFVFKKATAS